MKDSHTRLREQFQEFADGIVWSNDDGSEKYIGVGNIADWWLSHFSTELESIRKEIEEKYKEVKMYPTTQQEQLDSYCKSSYNEALADISLLLSNRIQK